MTVQKAILGMVDSSHRRLSEFADEESALIARMRAWTNGRIYTQQLNAVAEAEVVRSRGFALNLPRVEAYGLLVQAVAEAHQGKYYSVEQLLLHAEELIQSIQDPWLSTSIGLHLKRVHMRLGDEGVNISAFAADIESAIDVEDDGLVWQIYNTISSCAEGKNNHAEAVSWIVLAHDFAVEKHLTFELLATRNRLCRYHLNIGNIDEAIELGRTTLDLIRLNPEYERLLVPMWHDLGHAEAARKDYRAASTNFRASADLAEKHGDWTANGIASFNDGRMHQFLHETDAAVACFEQALQAWDAAGAPTFMGFDVLSRWNLESIRSAWSWDIVDDLEQLLDQKERLHRDVHLLVVQALAESTQKLGEYLAAVSYRKLEFSLREAIWKDAANQGSHMATKAYDTREAQRRADEEARQSFVLNRALDEVVNLNARNEGLITQLRDQSAKLARLARQDGLTGVGNRRAFDDRLQRELTSNRSLSLHMLDIDNFKQINDRYSHSIGDLVLRRVAAIMQNLISSESDLVTRYGGDEFAILLMEADRQRAESMAERIRSAVERYSWHDIAVGLAVTVSIGVWTVESSHFQLDVVAKADELLRRVKSTGKNRVLIND